MIDHKAMAANYLKHVLDKLQEQEERPTMAADDLEEFRRYIDRLQRQVPTNPELVLSYFVSDPDSLESELAELTDRQEKVALLEEHLQGLHNELHAASDPDNLLRENLFNSLQHQFPSFGHRNPWRT